MPDPGDAGWQPEPGWQPLSAGAATSTLGVWSARIDGRAAVVKRLARPRRGDPAELSDPAHAAYWRRAADVAEAGLVRGTPGLRGPEPLDVAEDDAGVTVVEERVPPGRVSGVLGAGALARFAGADLPATARALARRQQRDRVERVARRGGWTLLARTPVADLSDRLWRRREILLSRLDALPSVPQHGDPVPGNLCGRHEDGRTVLAVDWSTLGHGPVGADLGYWSLSAREELGVLLAAYLGALPPEVVGAGADEEAVGLAARVSAVFTVLTRADWALARVAPGEGALAAKVRHPVVAPHLRALQRQLPQLEALLSA